MVGDKFVKDSGLVVVGGLVSLFARLIFLVSCVQMDIRMEWSHSCLIFACLLISLGNKRAAEWNGILPYLFARFLLSLDFLCDVDDLNVPPSRRSLDLVVGLTWRY